jgi:hypothetical protein
MTTQSASAPCFAVRTDSGDGNIHTALFNTAQARLDHLRQRAQEYFPGRTVPRAKGVTDEAVYLAQLLSFFLMIRDGKVSLIESVIREESVKPE